MIPISELYLRDQLHLIYQSRNHINNDPLFKHSLDKVLSVYYGINTKISTAKEIILKIQKSGEDIPKDELEALKNNAKVLYESIYEDIDFVNLPFDQWHHDNQKRMMEKNTGEELGIKRKYQEKHQDLNIAKIQLEGMIQFKEQMIKERRQDLVDECQNDIKNLENQIHVILSEINTLEEALAIFNQKARNNFELDKINESMEKLQNLEEIKKLRLEQKHAINELDDLMNKYVFNKMEFINSPLKNNDEIPDLEKSHFNKFTKQLSTKDVLLKVDEKVSTLQNELKKEISNFQTHLTHKTNSLVKTMNSMEKEGNLDDVDQTSLSAMQSLFIQMENLTKFKKQLLQLDVFISNITAYLERGLPLTQEKFNAVFKVNMLLDFPTGSLNKNLQTVSIIKESMEKLHGFFEEEFKRVEKEYTSDLTKIYEMYQKKIASACFKDWEFFFPFHAPSIQKTDVKKIDSTKKGAADISRIALHAEIKEKVSIIFKSFKDKAKKTYQKFYSNLKDKKDSLNFLLNYFEKNQNLDKVDNKIFQLITSLVSEIKDLNELEKEFKKIVTLFNNLIKDIEDKVTLSTKHGEDLSKRDEIDYIRINKDVIEKSSALINTIKGILKDLEEFYNEEKAIEEKYAKELYELMLAYEKITSSETLKKIHLKEIDFDQLPPLPFDQAYISNYYLIQKTIEEAEEVIEKTKTKDKGFISSTQLSKADELKTMILCEESNIQIMQDFIANAETQFAILENLISNYEEEYLGLLLEKIGEFNIFKNASSEISNLTTKVNKFLDVSEIEVLNQQRINNLQLGLDVTDITLKIEEKEKENLELLKITRNFLNRLNSFKEAEKLLKKFNELDNFAKALLGEFY